MSCFEKPGIIRKLRIAKTKTNNMIEKNNAEVRQYIEENKDRFFEELFSLMRIPSVSAKPEHKQDMTRCAERYVELLKEAGADEAGVFPTAGNPVVFGQKIIDPTLKTVLVYGHYDVQPAEPLEKWNSDPFEPEIHDGAIWGRGANDDKGQTFMHLKAFEYLVRKGLLKHNVKFIFEGEEEVGSKSLPAWVEANKERLACDVILVSDTTMISDKVPSINCGMRGVTYLQVNVQGPDKDLHSGHYGGAVANPINTLCDMISTLIDEDGRVTIPGFYDDVVEVSDEDRKELARAPFDIDEYKESIGIDEVKGEKGYTTWSARRSGLAWMCAESGADIPESEARLCCRPRLMRKFPCASCLTRKRTRSLTWQRSTYFPSPRLTRM